MSADDGVRAAVGAAIGDAVEAAREADAEQLDMLPPLRRALSPERRAEIAEGARKRGRPPGAKNLATRDALDFVRRVFGDPLIERSRWLLLSPDELASAIGCTTAEAFDRQDAIRADLARFFYAPLAAVDGQGNVVPPTLVMAFGEGLRGAGGADRPPWDYPHETQQIQGFSEGAAPVSHVDVSHGEPK